MQSLKNIYKYIGIWYFSLPIISIDIGPQKIHISQALAILYNCVTSIFVFPQVGVQSVSYLFGPNRGFPWTVVQS